MKGIDVSKWQGDIDWVRLGKESGLSFAFARVSDGAHHVDPRFEGHWRAMKSIGLIRGAYQFFRAGQDPMLQADLLLEKIGPVGPGDLPPTLDLETSDHQDKALVISRAHQWLLEVEERTGRKPLLYTSHAYWAELGNPPEFSDYPLWIANYGVSHPHLPPTWPTWHFWQYTSNGRVAGISGEVDLDQFNGTLAQLRELAGHPKDAAEAPPPHVA